MVMEVGRVCVKIAGRDAGKKCVIIDVLDDKFVMIDGATRRRKCNILHLEPLEHAVKIKKGASHEEVSNALKEMGIEARVSKPKPKKERTKKLRGQKKAAQPAQTAAKKEKKGLFGRKKKSEEKKEGSLEEKAGESQAIGENKA